MRKQLIVAFLLIAAALNIHGDEDAARESFGVNASRALDALIGNLYPGAQLQWSPRLTIVQGSGTRNELRVAAVVERQDADGYTYVMPLEIVDEERAIASALDKNQPPATTSKTEIVAFKVNAQNAITTVHRGILTDSAAMTRIASMREFVGAEVPPLWPRVTLTYNAYYGTSDSVSKILWEGMITTDPVQLIQRLPNFVGKVKNDGAVVKDYPFIVVRENGTIFDIYSREQTRFIMSCTDPCLPDGNVVLGLWGPTSAAVAATP